MPLTWPTSIPAPEGAVAADQERLWLTFKRTSNVLDVPIQADDAEATPAVVSDEITSYIAELTLDAADELASRIKQSGVEQQIPVRGTSGITFNIAGDPANAKIGQLVNAAMDKELPVAARTCSFVYVDSYQNMWYGAAIVGNDGSPVSNPREIKSYPIRLNIQGQVKYKGIFVAS